MMRPRSGTYSVAAAAETMTDDEAEEVTRPEEDRVELNRVEVEEKESPMKLSRRRRRRARFVKLQRPYIQLLGNSEH
jgi:hypothetical protein